VPLPYCIERGYLLLADAIFDRVTGPVPSHGQLKQCKIISHRGVHDNHQIRELNRGIDWIFLNSALRVQHILNEAIDRKRAC
jgi:hypothetical protein